VQHGLGGKVCHLAYALVQAMAIQRPSFVG
jgi:hypothetical protein